jgi:hypothetical protein
MNKRNIMTTLLGGLLGIFTACGQKTLMPDGALLSLDYTISGTMAGYEYEAHVETLKNGNVEVRASSEPYGPLVVKTVDKSALDSLRTIIETEKMYAYKNHYEPPFEVLDGRMWSFHALFEGDKSISSHGSNAWPKGDGLSRIREYIATLVGQ